MGCPVELVENKYTELANMPEWQQEWFIKSWECVFGRNSPLCTAEGATGLTEDGVLRYLKDQKGEIEPETLQELTEAAATMRDWLPGPDEKPDDGNVEGIFFNMHCHKSNA